MLVNKANKVDEDYVPDDLVLTDSIYKDNVYLNKKCYDNFKKMQEEALFLGYRIDIMSGYRDYKYQEKIYNKLVFEKGNSYAKRSIASPGSSEHQTGLAIDFCVYLDNKCYIEHDIVDMLECEWVHKNCYKYGFIVRYPYDKEEVTGYNYEPWHIRYVGDIAEYLYKNNLTLDEYYQENVGKI
jgi:D-alanyl-D-alanine carboxypeptidase